MNPDVSVFLDDVQHPLRAEIDDLRALITGLRPDIGENIKWNGPNFHVNGEDRVSVKVRPGASFQVIFHIGAKVKPAPPQPMIADEGGILSWKSTDRAVASFKTAADYRNAREHLRRCVADWFRAAL